MKLSFLVVLFLFASLAFAPFTLSGEGMAANTQGSELQALVVKDNNAFAVDLSRNLSKTGGNLFFSPYSISVALGMIYMGDRGKTAEQMAKILHFTLKGDTLHRALGILVKKMNDAGRKGNY